MNNLELRSDEIILLRSKYIYIYSIPFEGILTNKRIIFTDNGINLLQQKEIPLEMLLNIDMGENAIQDQTITLSVSTDTGKIKKINLTFTRQTGNNRIMERNEWLKSLKENLSSFNAVSHKIIPEHEQAPQKNNTIQPQFGVKKPLIPNDMQITIKNVSRNVIEPPLLIKEVIKNSQTPPLSDVETSKYQTATPSYKTVFTESDVHIQNIDVKHKPFISYSTTSHISESLSHWSEPIAKQKSLSGIIFKPDKQVILGFVAILITVILFFLAAALNISVIFVIGLNVLLIFIELIDATKYHPKYLQFMKYAATTATIMFLFIVGQSIFYAL